MIIDLTKLKPKRTRILTKEEKGRIIADALNTDEGRALIQLAWPEFKPIVWPPVPNKP